MTSRDIPPPEALADEDLDMSGGWLFEGCYKHSVDGGKGDDPQKGDLRVTETSTDALVKDSVTTRTIKSGR